MSDDDNDDNHDDSIIYDSCVLIGRAAAFAGKQRFSAPHHHRSGRYGRKARQRQRRSVSEIYIGLGPDYFRRAYRMHYSSFWKLHDELEERIEHARLEHRGYEKKGGREGGSYLPPPVRNGHIQSSVRLACALRYFAGGSPYDLMGKYGISHTVVMESVWYVVEAINNTCDMDIEYPESAEEQNKIALQFKKVSSAGIDICAGAIDGILIWMKKPSMKEAINAECGQLKFLCGRKGKFGLNCQAVSDVRGKILDISIAYGGASSDCLAFERSKLHERCENGLMKDKNVLFGENAYLNTQYMATPYSNVSGNMEYKTRDDYNFYHSQLRIRVECCFGMLVQRWGILRTALSQGISLTRIVALVNTLARLHNYCIDEADRLGVRDNLTSRLPIDVQYMMENENGFIELQQSAAHGMTIPIELISPVENFVDVGDTLLRHHRYNNPEETLPRAKLHRMIADGHYSRPAGNARRRNTGL